MLKSGKRLQRRRIYSEEFKLQIVKIYESGQRTALELTRDYGLAKQTVYRWIYQYSNYNRKSLQIVEYQDSQTHRVKELEAKVRELEQAVGRKQMNIDFLEKMIDLAKEQFEIDIKKNFETPPSGGSKPITKS